jgi:hypothetical protein
VAHVLALQRAAGNRAVQTLLARSGLGTIQRDIGWTGKDVDPKSPNAPPPEGKPRVTPGTSVLRIPVQGIPEARTESDLDDWTEYIDEVDPVTKQPVLDPKTNKPKQVGIKPVRDFTREKPGGADGGRAIVLIPQTLPEADTVEVLFHLHGHTLGYRSHGRRHEVDDEGIYRIEQQLDAIASPPGAKGGRPMIAILPQGGWYSGFGAGRKAVNVDAYIASALALVPEAVWPRGKRPKAGGVILSGHSGAGSPLGTMFGTADEKDPAKRLLPEHLEGVILFDTINKAGITAGGQFDQTYNFAVHQLDGDLAQLKKIEADEKAKAGTDDQIRIKQVQWLQKDAFRFRAFATHSAYEKSFKALADKLQKEWFDKHEAELGGAKSAVYAALRANYSIAPAGEGVEHMQMIGGVQNKKTGKYEHENLKDALSSMPERPQATLHTPTPSGAPAPTPVPAHP